MKKVSLLLAMIIAIPAISQAKVITCSGYDRGETGVKFMAKGNLKEKQAFGQYFAEGEMAFKITEPGKPVFEVILPIAISTYPQKGYVNIVRGDGGDLYEENGHTSDPRQLSIGELLSWGHYVSYRSPAIGGKKAASYLIDVSCTDLKF